MGSRTGGGTQLEPVREAYMEWCRYPDRQTRVAAGLPATRADFAKFWNVNRTTIWRWENDEDFKRETTSVVLGMIKLDTLALTLRAIEQKAMDGNVQAAKMLFEMAGVMGKMSTGPNHPKSGADDDFDNMTAEELEAFIASQDEGEDG
jgi:hypothetical protein